MSEPVIVQHAFQASVSEVWKAVTVAEEMRRWYFDVIESFEPRVGFETQFDVHHQDDVYRHRWAVTEVDPEKCIAYTWRYEGRPGNSLVRFDLSEIDEGTLLQVTHEVTEPFPDEPIFSRENGQAGWEYLIQESLAFYLS